MRSADPAQVIRSVGRRIAELRALKAWSQAQLAEAMNIALQGVQRMEQGRQNLTIKTIVQVANKLGCSPRDLWEAPTSTPTRGRPAPAKAVATVVKRPRSRRSDA